MDPDPMILTSGYVRPVWHQWWFHTSGGRLALEQDRARVCEYLWWVWSPQWRFQPDEFAAVASTVRLWRAVWAFLSTQTASLAR
jgi:hypothetical protein